jgi:transmembrane sensor
VLRLNTDSAVTILFSDTERAVSVERGQALFQVAPDGKRRFRVAAADTQTLSVGTQFEVYRKPGNTVVVTVIDGMVSVFMGHPPPTQDLALPVHALRVGAGQQARIEAGIMPSQPVPVNLQETLAWLNRKISFEQQPLGEVADEFNRYARIPFAIDDPALRALPISGVFDAYDSDSFAAFLETLDGVAVERASTGFRVVGRPSPDREAAPENR